MTASAQKAHGGCHHFYVGSNKEMAREFIDAAAMWAKVFNKAAGEIQEEVFIDAGDGKSGDKEILTFVIYFASGFKIQALSSNPSNLRGMQGNVTIDEAAFHDRLAEVLKAALALTMWGSKIRLISTHNSVDNLFNQLIQDSRAGKKDYSVHTITLDDACADGLYKRICQITKKPWSQQAQDDWIAGLLKATASKEDALEEYYCVPKQGGGAYLLRSHIEQAMNADYPIVKYEAGDEFITWSKHRRELEIETWCDEVLAPLLETLNDDHSHSFGEDFARKGDLTVLIPMEIRKDLSKHVPFQVELRNLTYDQQRQVLFYMLDSIPRLVGMAFDATGNGGYLAEQALLKYGAEMVECIMLNEKWYREWMPKLKAEFEDGNIQLPKHADNLDDLRHIKVINGVPKIEKGKSKGEDGKQRHGDMAVGLAMANRASEMEGSAIEFEAIPESASRFDPSNDDDDFNEFQPRGW
ncbi:terminase family protein [Psychromonas sp. MME2]|uniref:terminase large subunit domain-containing protein n=1 Tax=Psychromonas sp. MME2 TaxID=3231033 RepID=UPI00339BAFB8